MSVEPTLEALLYARAGLLDGARIAAPLLAWIEASALGNGGEYASTGKVARFWEVDERTAARWRAEIREFFTNEELRSIVSDAASRYEEGESALRSQVSLAAELLA